MVSKRAFWRSLGTVNIAVGFLSCIAAIALVAGLIPWPFAGPKPTETDVLLIHFSLAAFGFAVLGWLLHAVRLSDRPVRVGSLHVSLGVLVTVTGGLLSGLVQLVIVADSWLFGYERSQLSLWLSVPGITGLLAMFWVVNDAGDLPDERRQPPKGADYAWWEIIEAETFSKTILFKRALLSALLLVIAMGALIASLTYAYVISSIFQSENFVGWYGVWLAITRSLCESIAGITALAALTVFSAIVEKLVVRASSSVRQSLAGQTPQRLTEEQAETINEITDQLMDAVVFSRGSLTHLLTIIRAAALGAFVAIVFTAMRFLPADVSVPIDRGIGSTLFAGRRTEGLGPHIYFDGMGIAEAVLLCASIVLIAYIGYLLTRNLTALRIWSWQFIEPYIVFRLIALGASEAVRAGDIKEPQDYTLANAAAATSRRYERGSLALTGLLFLTACLAWPLDRAHYAVVSDEEVVAGHYYLPGSVRAFAPSDVTRVNRECWKRVNKDVVAFDLTLPNGAVVDLIRPWHIADSAQRDLIIRVGTKISGAEVDGRVDQDVCGELLRRRFGDDSEKLKPLFGLEN
ncbi:MAG: hypothetical protein AAGH41_11035 [Pseudomonadota bacterium]